jgi:hypothetical protein
VVAVGSLDRVWLEVPEYSEAEALEDAFQRRFGAEWADVLDAVDKSFAYNAANDAYFSVRDIRPVANLTLDELIRKAGGLQPSPNVIIS